MKSTKIVDVDVCDLCHDEEIYSYRMTYISCGKSICGKCETRFRIEVERIVAHRADGATRSWSHTPMRILGNENLTYYATYCAEGGTGIERNLMKAGFVPALKDDA